MTYHFQQDNLIVNLWSSLKIKYKKLNINWIYLLNCTYWPDYQNKFECFYACSVYGETKLENDNYHNNLPGYMGSDSGDVFYTDSNEMKVKKYLTPPSKNQDG